VTTNKVVQFFYTIWLYIINYVAKIPLGWMLWTRLGVTFRNLRLLYTLKPPYLILPNHTNQWDPLMICWANPRPIRWVAADANFRSGFRFLMRIAGTIPKAKEQSDLDTIKELTIVNAARGIPGIFPEGGQNWDGVTGVFIPATAKLVRFLKVPVVVPVIKGGYLSKPRWSWTINRGKVVVEFRLAITGEEIKTLKLGEIEERLRFHLDHDDYAWQREVMVPLKGEDRAEHLELALWACPSCREIGTLRSNGNTMGCLSCGYEISVDRYGFIQYPESGPTFGSPHEWDQWQRRELADRFRRMIGAKENPLLLEDGEITLMKAESRGPYRPVANGSARLYTDRIEFHTETGEKHVFSLPDVLGITVFKQHKLEFRYERDTYFFLIRNQYTSAYKWYIAYHTLRAVLSEGETA
jgi:1-acyl-sn-glycerol-3-phosphate acyltransferase